MVVKVYCVQKGTLWVNEVQYRNHNATHCVYAEYLAERLNIKRDRPTSDPHSDVGDIQRRLSGLHHLTNESWKDEQSKPGPRWDRWEKLRMSAVVKTLSKAAVLDTQILRGSTHECFWMLTTKGRRSLDYRRNRPKPWKKSHVNSEKCPLRFPTMQLCHILSASRIQLIISALLSSKLDSDAVL